MDDILTLPIDQYQRYRMAAQVADALRNEGQKYRALEVGGYPPKLKAFLKPDDSTLVTDTTEFHTDGYLRANALDLPFPENSFDLVIALDVLEHLPQGDRLDFIAELMRVSSQFLILAAPFDDSPMVKTAEEILLDYINEIHGYEHIFFKEHLMHGLPVMKDIEKTLSAEGWETVLLPNGYFPRWFGMTLLDYALEGRAEEARAKLRRFYNLNFYPLDNREPAYRRFVVASREGFGDNRRQKLNSLISTGGLTEWPPMEFLTTIVEVARLNAQDSLVRQIEGLKHDLAARDEEIKHLKQYIKETEQFTDKIKDSVPYRIYSRLFK